MVAEPGRRLEAGFERFANLAAQPGFLQSQDELDRLRRRHGEAGSETAEHAARGPTRRGPGERAGRPSAGSSPQTGARVYHHEPGSAETAIVGAVASAHDNSRSGRRAGRSLLHVLQAERHWAGRSWHADGAGRNATAAPTST